MIANILVYGETFSYTLKGSCVIFIYPELLQQLHRGTLIVLHTYICAFKYM